MARTARGRTITSRVLRIARVGGPVGLFPSLLCLLFFALGQSHAQCEYAVTVIKAPECPIFGPPPIHGRGINELGQIAGSRSLCGSSFGDDAAFLWTAESGIVMLDMPTGTFESFAFDVNDAGQVIGTFNVAGDGFSVLAYVSQDKVLTVIPPPAGTFSRAFTISNSGQVVGATADNTSFHKGFLWEEGQMTLILPTFGSRSLADDINEIGQVVGWMGTVGIDSHAFVWETGVMTDLGVPPGASSARATAINNLGRIVMTAGFANSPSRSFLWINGELTDLGVLPGFDHTVGWDINDFDQIVGICQTAAPPFIRIGFIWQNGVITDLNALVADESIDITDADAINNAGQIAASGGSDSEGAALLLTPMQICPADFDCDGFVGITDFLDLLMAWGPHPDHPADLNNDGAVGIVDFLMLLASWGPCL